MSHEQNTPYDSNPGTEAIRRIKIPGFGGITVDDIDSQIQQLNDLRGVAKVEAMRHASDQQMLDAAALVRRMKGDVAPQLPVDRRHVSPETAGDYTQGMAIVYANDDVRSAHVATRNLNRPDYATSASEGTVVDMGSGPMRVMPDGVVYRIGAVAPSAPQYLPEAEATRVDTEATPKAKRGREKLRSPQVRIGLGVVAVMLAAGGGIVATQINNAGKSTGAGQNVGNEHVVESAILPLTSVAGKLAESFDGCLNDQGQGAPILRAKQTAIVPESWPYTAPDKSKVVLSATLNGQTVKPVVKLAPPSASDKSQPDWNVGITACVTKDNAASVVTVDEKTRTVTIDYSKVSPQLQEGASSYLVGFLRNDADTTATKGEDVIKALQDKKYIDPAEATRLTTAYTDKPTNAAESAQAVRRASEAIAKTGDIYEKQISASLQAKIQSLVKGQLDTLRSQGAISKDDVTVKTTGDMNPMTIAGPEPAKADAFTTDQAKIIQFEIASEANS
jgi:hypothetical protein